MFVKDIFDKLQDSSNIDLRKDLIFKLGITKGNYDVMLQRNSISFKNMEKIINFCAKNHIDLNYIFLEDESKKKVNMEQKLSYLESELNQLRKEIRV